MTREKKRCAHIDVHEFIVFLGAGIYEVLVVAHSGVVDEDVDAAKHTEFTLEPPFVQVVPLSRSGSREAIAKILTHRNNRQFLDLLIENVLAASQGEPAQEAPQIPLSVVMRASV